MTFPLHRRAGGIISTARGDTCRIDINVCCGELVGAYHMFEVGDGDSLYFGVMAPHEPFERSLIKKTFHKGDLKDGILTITLAPEDTEDLIPGTYYYSLKLRKRAQGKPDEIYTVLERTKLFISE